mgnify:FL=1
MSIRRFKLPEEFVKRYQDKSPQWGYMDEAGNSMGEITFLRSYSRLKSDGSKETWAETCQRVIEGMFTIQREHCFRNRLPWDSAKAQRTARDAYDRLFCFKWMPPGRGLANMGTDFVIDDWDGTPLQNCAFVSTKHDLPDAIHFLMLASMNGVGVGLDVDGGYCHRVKGANGTIEWVIPDTREGWAEALEYLIVAHLEGKPRPIFDYSKIRPAGALIARFGGTASGPDALHELLDWLDGLFDERKGEVLTTRDIADIANRVGCCVVSGSSRRSAELLLGNSTDEYLSLKDYGHMEGDTWVEGPSADRQTFGWMSNNSVRATVGQDYDDLAKKTAVNGEPGYVWMDTTRAFGRMKDKRDNKDYRAAGFNPCVEQPLEPHELCCLVETFPTRAESVTDYLKTLKVAFLYAKSVTLLPTFSEKSNAVMARNRRIGLSQTGISTYVEDHGIAAWRQLCDEGYKEVQRLDNIYSDWLCVRPSIRTTTVKPSGTVSLLTGDSPGVHWNPASGYYIRRVTMPDNELLAAVREAGYVVEESVYSKGQYVVAFPVKSPFKRSEKDVTIWEKVALAAEAQHWWSDNSVSVTVSFDPETEGKHIPWILSLYEGRVKALSFLPMSTGVYPQMPYEEITEEKYREMCDNLKPLPRDIVYGRGDQALGERFCTTDACEIKTYRNNNEGR